MSRQRVFFAAAAAGAISAVFHSGLLPWSVGYNDVLHLSELALAVGWPYIDRPVEYPVLMGLLIRFSGWLGGGPAGYYIVTAGALTAAAALAAGLLLEDAAPAKVLRRWCLAPSMLAFLVFNWDVVAVLCCVAAFAAAKRERAAWTGVLLGLGFCFKLYPALYLPPALISWRKNPRRCLELVAGFGVTAAAVNLPFAVVNYSGWSYCFAFNFARDRMPNPDSIWSVLRFIFGGPAGAGAGEASSALLLAGLSFALWRLRDQTLEKMCFAATLVLLLAAKFFSPQYALWVLPLLVLEDAPALPSYGFELANLGALFAILQYILGSQGKIAYEACAVFVALRHACLAGLLWALIRSCAPRPRSAP